VPQCNGERLADNGQNIAIGANYGDGIWLWRVWNIRTVRGGFHLWPEGEDDPTQRQLRAEEELLKPRRLKRGELVGGIVP